MEENVENVIIGLEQELLKSDVRKSRERLDEFLSDDFFEFGQSGKRLDKENILEYLPTSNEVVFSPSDFEVVVLTENTILLTYFLRRNNSKGSSWRSSLWRKENGNWRMFFHQGTPAKER